MQRLVMQSRFVEGTAHEGSFQFPALTAPGTNRMAAALVTTSNDWLRPTDTETQHLEKTVEHHESGLSLMLRQTLAVRKAGEQH